MIPCPRLRRIVNTGGLDAGQQDYPSVPHSDSGIPICFANRYFSPAGGGNQATMALQIAARRPVRRRRSFLRGKACLEKTFGFSDTNGASEGRISIGLLHSGNSEAHLGSGCVKYVDYPLWRSVSFSRRTLSIPG